MDVQLGKKSQVLEVDLGLSQPAIWGVRVQDNGEYGMTPSNISIAGPGMLISIVSAEQPSPTQQMSKYIKIESIEFAKDL